LVQHDQRKVRRGVAALGRGRGQAGELGHPVVQQRPRGRLCQQVCGPGQGEREPQPVAHVPHHAFGLDGVQDGRAGVAVLAEFSQAPIPVLEGELAQVVEADLRVGQLSQ